MVHAYSSYCTGYLQFFIVTFTHLNLFYSQQYTPFSLHSFYHNSNTTNKISKPTGLTPNPTQKIKILIQSNHFHLSVSFLYFSKLFLHFYVLELSLDLIVVCCTLVEAKPSNIRMHQTSNIDVLNHYLLAQFLKLYHRNRQRGGGGGKED